MDSRTDRAAEGGEENTGEGERDWKSEEDGRGEVLMGGVVRERMKQEESTSEGVRKRGKEGVSDMWKEEGEGEG